ncbi:class I SAM-dependent methyltransferase [Amycolatopsis keratiniphila]|uniref:class I SAM-dependent methyltransferase n=1 Tax=Amycolatopsis keratiniphila TaxID=129921 RepID=UPI001E490DB5|nr:class I SAM-dependent methyltransferase [Amycolatopsis keratiniphila]
MPEVDPFGGRCPTSHERMTGLRHGARRGLRIGRERAPPRVARISVLGVDVADAALDIARRKASERGLEAEFQAADALRLERLGQRFDTAHLRRGRAPGRTR